jgi:succinylglutamic semialdehyde dehydrogenase
MSSHLINNRWIDGDGAPFTSTNPASGETLWTGREATPQEVDQAIAAARDAFPEWADAPLPRRIALLEAFAVQLRQHRDELAEAIAQETGKPRWESLTEVDAMIGKIPISIEAHATRCAERAEPMPGATAAMRFRPHGVVAVFGPYNFPGHLPNGHIVPALLAGNTIVFKPSEQTPLIGRMAAELWLEAGAPAGVLNLVQGARETGQALVNHHFVDGVFFTGSAQVGRAIRRTLADQPEKILALEMGGNNPLIIHEAGDIDAAAYAVIQSAYLTSGQRCSCARRLILPRSAEADQLIDRVSRMMSNMRVGAWNDDPEPFMGPLISTRAAGYLLDAQGKLRARGARPIVEMKPLDRCAAMLTPGLIDVTPATNRPDEEHFGPLLQVIRVEDFEAALAEANNTRFGLSAGLISRDRELWNRFYRRIRAGVVNWNRPTTGASSRLPFGGIGHSGNHRPSAYLAADYAAWPVASIESESAQLPAKPPPGIAL